MTPLQQKTLGIMRSQLGVHEIGVSNTGPEVNEYLASVNLDPGNPWCMAFVAWSIQRAAKALGVTSQWPRSGSCEVVRTWAVKTGRILHNPVKGAIFLRINPKTKLAEHTGIVESVVDPSRGIFAQISGNSNYTGAREGTMVCHNMSQNQPPGSYVFVMPV